MNLLVFRLEGPLQSWGECSRWDHRDTALMPTKSGIVGLIGSCLGYPRGDERLAMLSRSIWLAVRADRPGMVMTDYHTVQGTGGVLLNAQRKKRPGDTILTPRQYLQNAAFQIFIEADEEVLRMCACGLKSPFWPPFLGRKSCPPSIPIVPKIVNYPSLEEAARTYPLDMRDSKRLRGAEIVLQAEIECAAEEREQDAVAVRVRQDEILDAKRNQYLSRRVRVIGVPAKGESACS